MPKKSLYNYKAFVFDLDGTLYYKKGLNKKIALSFLFNLPMLLSYQKARKRLFSIDCENTKSYNTKLHHYASEERYSIFNNNLIKKTQKGEDWYNNIFYPVFCKTLSKYYKTESFVLQTLKQIEKYKIPMICYSDYSFIKERLQSIGIDPQLFAVLLSSEEAGALKPAARPVLELCNSLNIEPSEVLIIGDRPDTDGETASLAGTDYYRIFDVHGKKDYLNSWENLSIKLI